jgi:hypothetical protein
MQVLAVVKSMLKPSEKDHRDLQNERLRPAQIHHAIQP